MTDWHKPSTSTPFFRRFFGDERGREQQETRQLYDAVAARHTAFQQTPITIGTEVAEFFRQLPEHLYYPMIRTLDYVIKTEHFIFEMPAWDDRLNLKEWADLRNFLREKEYFFANESKVLQLLHEGLACMFTDLAEDMPKSEAPSPFTVPLIYALPDPGLAIMRIISRVAEDQYTDRGLFRQLANSLMRNLYEISNIPLGSDMTKRKFKLPHENKVSHEELRTKYLAGTPFEVLFDVPVPLKLTHSDRFNHMHIVGGTGAGKTTLLENLILHDLKSDNPPAMVIIDSQGDLIRKLSHADLGLGDRLVLITPKDIKYPPALNIFDVNASRMGKYDEMTREQVTAGVIQTFDYLFTGLLGADLTAKQGVFFKYVARLMLALPEALGRNATILDMMNLMEDATPYKAAIESLPPIQRNFFERDFQSKTFGQTKEQIRYRLQAIIENPTLARLFTTPDTKVDIFTELNRGSIILVDTAKDFLKGSSSHFGRIFISLVLQAVLERAALPENERRDTFLIVDEAASYFDANIDDLLTDARKYRCGCVFAHQYLDQASSSLRASLAANTSIKFAAGVSNSDARAMATDMRTKPDFILGQPKLHFAAHIRNVTPQAVSIPVEYGHIEALPQLSERAYGEMIERNRAHVSFGATTAPRQLASLSPRDAEPDPDVSDKW